MNCAPKTPAFYYAVLYQGFTAGWLEKRIRQAAGIPTLLIKKLRLNVSMKRFKSSSFFVPLVACLSVSGQASAQQSSDSIFDLELEDLLSIEVTSVSKKKQRLDQAAAAVYVITGDDIRRSGVTTIADALRMAPGVQVARIDSNKWAVSSRGFNGQFANKLLVLMDGRSVYTSSYSGVYWEDQDTMLEDIDRIEVIRGPGATLWGANAVNGVINIITKSAADTLGTTLVAGRGDEEIAFGRIRHGFSVGDSGAGRFYFKGNQRDSSYAPGLDDDANDHWQSFRSGFRVDMETDPGSNWTFQGDTFDNDSNQIVKLIYSDPAVSPPALDYRLLNTEDQLSSRGSNLLARWSHEVGDDSVYTLQGYVDQTYRKELILTQEITTFDLDFQHRYTGIEDHDIIWGLGYRSIDDDFDGSFSVDIDNPDSLKTELVSAFIQDEITLDEDLTVTVGSKFEENDYTGTEVQPSARALWQVSSSQSIWGSVSQAVRTPSAVERRSSIVGFVIPGIPFPPIDPTVGTVDGSDDFDSEKLTAIEFGYRAKPSSLVSLDLALFYNDYKDVLSFEVAEVGLGLDPASPPSLTAYPTVIEFDNKRDVTATGVEALIDWYFVENWRLQTAYTYTSISEDLADDSTDRITADIFEDSVPQHQLSVRSFYDYSDTLELNAWVYYVDQLDASAYSADSEIDSYYTVNVGLNWRPQKNLELSFAGLNLNESRHAEFVGENFITPAEIERSTYLQLKVDF